MNALARTLPRRDTLRDQFLDGLESATNTIACHVLTAWDGETTETINRNLEQARDLLRDIAGTAQTAGLPELSATAQLCEAQIMAHLEGPYADLAICPGEILWRVDTFVEACAAATGSATAAG